MTNKGAAPIDPSIPVGQLRALIGDTASVPLVPDEPGFADYANYSDVALQALVTLAGDNVYRAAGNIFLQYAASWAAQGESIKTDDLAIDMTKKSADYRELAKTYFAQADALDEQAAGSSFAVIPFGGRTSATPERVEASPWPVSWA